jgi:hypothetical protein
MHEPTFERRGQAAADASRLAECRAARDHAAGASEATRMAGIFISYTASGRDWGQ